jgi:serpin B
MVANGAAGATKTEMERVLGASGGKIENLNEDYRRLGETIRSARSNVVLNIANAVWYRPGADLKPAFEAVNTRYYDATLQALDFTDPRSAGMVNRWAEEKTQGKIKKIVDGPLSGATQLLLANAVYFKAAWLRKFDSAATKDRLFRSPAGSRSLPMMEQNGEFEYAEANGFQAVRLPYAGGRLGMTILLPGTNSTAVKLLSSLDGPKWQSQVLMRLRRQAGMVALPRFKLEYGIKLNEPLKAMGMRRAFKDADFSEMSTTPLYVDEIRQKTFVEVNEEGTEAAAVTTGAMRATSVTPRQPPFQMVVDHPFLFVIHDQLTNTILFIGVMFEPVI